MKKFVILEEEKERILEMHKSRTQKHYLMEEIKLITGDSEAKKREFCYKYIVKAGDTMWDIANNLRQKYTTKKDQQTYFEELTANLTELGKYKEMGFDYAELIPGQEIPIPMSCSNFNPK